jgi:hypothetical protein
MTNHPNRKRDENEPSIEEIAAGAAEPLATEMREKLALERGSIPPQGSATVPAHTPNGLKPDPAVLAAKAVAQTLGEHLPNMLYQALTAALSQVPVQTVSQQHMCATCIIGRIQWENTHRAEMEQAMTAAAEAAGVVPHSPEAGRIDFGPFLPEALRPGGTRGIPGVQQAVTTFQGAEACPLHVAQAAGVQPGRSPLLVANAAFSPAMLGQPAG